MVLELELSRTLGGDRAPNRGRRRTSACVECHPGLRLEPMTLVGFDTSMAVTTACVIPPPASRSARRRPTPERLLGAPAHSAELLPALAELLERAGHGWDDVTAIAVGVGPGTFTGLRIGVATARGLAQALGVPLHPGLVAGGARRRHRGGRGGSARHAAPAADRRQARAGVRRRCIARASRSRREWGPLALDPEELVAAGRGARRNPRWQPETGR